jgi:hypothetical protein
MKFQALVFVLVASMCIVQPSFADPASEVWVVVPIEETGISVAFPYGNHVRCKFAKCVLMSSNETRRLKVTVVPATHSVKDHAQEDLQKMAKYECSTSSNVDGNIDVTLCAQGRISFLYMRLDMTILIIMVMDADGNTWDTVMKILNMQRQITRT